MCLWYLGAQVSSSPVKEGLPLSPHLQLRGAGWLHGPFNSKQGSLLISNLPLLETTDAFCPENKVTQNEKVPSSEPLQDYRSDLEPVILSLSLWFS